jgi:hypothetical protein
VLVSKSRRTSEGTSLPFERGERLPLLGKTFRLNNSILGIYTDDTLHKIPIALPKGATVLVVETDLNGNRLVDVIWEGKTVMMFTIDLRNRCTLVESELNIDT